MHTTESLYSQPRDKTIIAESPIVTGHGMELTRIVLRNMGDTYVVHMQYWPLSTSLVATKFTAPCYCLGHYFPKSEAGALGRAWDSMYSRYCLLVGREDRLAPRKNTATHSKTRLRTEITTLSQGEP